MTRDEELFPDEDFPASPVPVARVAGTLLGTYEIVLKAKSTELKTRARFFYNHQYTRSIWLEAPPGGPKLPLGTEVEVITPGVLEPFPAAIGGIVMGSREGSLYAALRIDPLQEPLDALPANNLQNLSFGVLASPIAEKRGILLPCAQFDITIAAPLEVHNRIAEPLGRSPHPLRHSATMVARNGQAFASSSALLALNTLHDVLSFAAGRWIGLTLVEGRDAEGNRTWFRLGAGKIHEPSYTPSWFDPEHPEWLVGLCDGLLDIKADEEAADTMSTALYWYLRSNTRGGGIDGALILTQCALELLSWFVIVRRFRALSEPGYGQLNSAAERLRLMLSLLRIPPHSPPGLPKLMDLQEEWDDMPDAVVGARNYLVHPTQSRSGKRRPKKDYPWDDLWQAGQWILELVILRLLGYQGQYRNRTRVKEFQRIDDVPWSAGGP